MQFYSTNNLSKQINFVADGQSFFLENFVNVAQGDPIDVVYVADDTTPTAAYTDPFFVSILDGGTSAYWGSVGPFPRECVDGSGISIATPSNPNITINGSVVSIVFTAPEEIEFTVIIFDEDGNPIFNATQMGLGEMLTFEAEIDPNGVYFVVIEQNGETVFEGSVQ